MKSTAEKCVSSSVERNIKKDSQDALFLGLSVKMFIFYNKLFSIIIYN